MDITFASKEELYKRVKPALRTKINEFKKLGYSYIKETDIWNFLIKKKWKNGNQLCLADIVSDIMHVQKEEVDDYDIFEALNMKKTIDMNLYDIAHEVSI